jgi:hypothetical protein
MRDLIVAVLMFHGVMFVLCLVWTILKQLYALPAVLFAFCMEFAKECFPAWYGDHALILRVILAVLILLPCYYWVRRFLAWLHRERVAQANWLAQARRISMEEMQEMCEKQR